MMIGYINNFRVDFLLEIGKTYTIPNNINYEFLVSLDPYYCVPNFSSQISYKVEVEEKNLITKNDECKRVKDLQFYTKTIKVVGVIDNYVESMEEWYENKDVLEFIKNLPLNPIWRSNTMFTTSTKNNKYILLNYNGEPISQFKFSYVTDVYDDIAVVWSMDKCKIINNKGELITNESFSRIQIKQEGDKRVIMVKPIASDTYKSSSIWNFLDDSGNIIFNDCPYEIVGSHITNDGYVMVENFVKGQPFKNFINKNNNLLWHEWETNAIVDDNFSDGFIRIKNENCSYNYKHKNGKTLLKYPPLQISKFKNGIAMICKDDYEHKLINTQGEIVGVANFDAFLKYYSNELK